MAATVVVQHGRRQGTPKSNLAETTQVGGNTLVLKRDEWDRLQAALANDDGRLAETQRMDERKRLHEASKESVAGWTNTIAGMRQQKLQAKALREQKEEERRVQLDIEEARYQAEKRKEAIQRARSLQYAQTDKAKGLQSAVLLSEVLRERELQSSIKHERSEALAAYEQELHQHTLRQLEEDERREAEGRMLQKEAALKVAEALVDQATAKREQRRERRAQQLSEQQEIDQRAAQYFEDMQTLRQSQRRQAHELLTSYEQQRQQRDEIDRLKQHFEEEDEKRRLEYVAAKERIARLKKEKELERISDAELRRTTMNTDLTAAAREREEREIAALQRALDEQDEKLRQLEADKQRRVEASIKEIKIHHAAERQRLHQQRQQAREQDIAERQENEKADTQFIQGEKTRAARQRDTSTRLRDEHLETMMVKGHARVEERETEAAERMAALRAAEQEDEYFRRFALQQAEAAQQRGCTNVVPILRVAAPPAPPRQAPREGKAWKRGPGNPAPGNTTLRLGFTWKD